MVYCRVSNNVIKEANNHQTMMQSQSLTCNAGVFWTGEICLFMFDMALLRANQSFARPTKTPTQQAILATILRSCLKLTFKKNSRNAFSVKISLSCMSLTLFKWGKRKNQLA